MISISLICTILHKYYHADNVEFIMWLPWTNRWYVFMCVWNCLTLDVKMLVVTALPLLLLHLPFYELFCNDDDGRSAFIYIELMKWLVLAGSDDRTNRMWVCLYYMFDLLQTSRCYVFHRSVRSKSHPHLPQKWPKSWRSGWWFAFKFMQRCVMWCWTWTKRLYVHIAVCLTTKLTSYLLSSMWGLA